MNGSNRRPKIALLTECTVDFCFSKLNVETVEVLLNSTNCYDIYIIIIRGDRWVYKSAAGKDIDVDKNDFSITIDGKKIRFDAALNIIDDSDGKNANIQGYLEMMNIPTPNSTLLPIALAFDKILTNRIISTLDIIKVPKSIKIEKGCPYSLDEIQENLRFPLIVKPVFGTNSFGVVKIDKLEDLEAAIKQDLEICSKVVVEEFIPGRELTCAAYQSKGKVRVLGITERISKIAEFFDHKTKQTEAYEAITPADVPENIAEQATKVVETIYQEFGYKGIIRCDFRLQEPEQELYFLEVNSFPVLDKNGVVMCQCKEAGLDLGTILCEMLDECLLNFVN